MGPAAHLYGIFVVLSVLHVRALVSLFAGAISALGLAAIVAASIAAEGEGASEVLGIPRSLEMFSAVMLLVTGVAAAAVALRMRRYLKTATAEASVAVKIPAMMPPITMTTKARISTGSPMPTCTDWMAPTSAPASPASAAPRAKTMV